MEDRLKPCPFCGGEARTRDLSIKIPYDGIAHFVECCQCDVRSGISFDGEQGAIETWNTRKPIDRIVEALENQSHTWKPSSKEWWKQSNTTISLKKAIEIVKNGGKDE